MTKEQIAEATWKWLADDGRNVDMLVNRIYALQSEANGEATELVSLLLAVLEREGITGGARDKARAYLKRVRYSDIEGSK